MWHCVDTPVPLYVCQFAVISLLYESVDLVPTMPAMKSAPKSSAQAKAKSIPKSIMEKQSASTSEAKTNVANPLDSEADEASSLTDSKGFIKTPLEPKTKDEKSELKYNVRALRTLTDALKGENHMQAASIIEGCKAKEDRIKVVAQLAVLKTSTDMNVWETKALDASNIDRLTADYVSGFDFLRD